MNKGLYKLNRGKTAFCSKVDSTKWIKTLHFPLLHMPSKAHQSIHLHAGGRLETYCHTLSEKKWKSGKCGKVENDWIS